MAVEDMKRIGSVVSELKDYTIMKYEPQEVVIDIVKNFYLKKYKKDFLLKHSVGFIRAQSKQIYRRSNKSADSETLNNFASDVVFHLAYTIRKEEDEREAHSGQTQDERGRLAELPE